MIARITSHPLSRLAVLALITLTTYSRLAIGAELSTQENAVPAANLDQHFVSALLTPMSRLVESPYANPGAVDNPLRLRERSSTTAVLAQAVIGRPISAPSTQPRIEMLNVEIEKTEPKMEIAPPEASDGTLPALGAEQTNPAPLGLKTALAMAGR